MSITFYFPDSSVPERYITTSYALDLTKQEWKPLGKDFEKLMSRFDRNSIFIEGPRVSSSVNLCNCFAAVITYNKNSERSLEGRVEIGFANTYGLKVALEVSKVDLDVLKESYKEHISCTRSSCIDDGKSRAVVFKWSAVNWINFEETSKDKGE